MADGVSKCGRKAALSVFFSCSVIGFVFCLLSLLSPSWQYVYLENGRTEHHHGLWLDCKRDYSYDYGRPREYYETLWRRDLEGSPFAVFFLPPLNCVYKFDYYIDPEDLYDHDHDENRIQNDAYQHLFLGWKVAALSGVGVSVCFCMAALLLGICSFCHRTFICACTVLITIAAFLSSVGWIVFYIWGNYQDNKVIKEEEDTIYEQKLGYAFYFQVVGSLILWFSSFLGCCVTSISLGKSRGAKLVKIEVVEGDDSVPLNGSDSSQQPFKRSFSAIYRVDSTALRQWEKDYLKRAREQAMAAEGNFKRTASMPNFSKKQQKQERRRARQIARNSQDFFSSTSNITEMTQASNLTLSTQQTAATAPAPLLPIEPSTPKLKSALKTPKSSRKNLNDTDPTYDYLACPSSVGVSSFLGGNSPPRAHVYDPVYEQIGPAQEYYLEPNSVKEGRSTLTLNKGSPTKALLPSLPVTGSSQSIPTQQKTTFIDDVVRPLSWQTEQKKNAETQADTRKIHERRTIEEMTRLERFKKMSRPVEPPPKPAMNIREFGIDLSKKSVGIAEISKDTPKEPVKISPLKYASVKDTGPLLPPTSSPHRYTQINKEDPFHRKETSVDDLPDPPPGIALNTFGVSGRASQRSITNLTFIPGSSSVPDVFERPDSSASSCKTGEKKVAVNLHRQLFSALPDEVDRSVGSSTQFENETMSDTASYVKDANIRLNLFLNEKTAKTSQDETTV